ncbi:hypothetical protein SEA_POKYPUPPY_2 [Gordonia phage PokyPuppy]|nr:hypothetical protein SEA_POKYPUPPY_2 [Gordonia phage PokyPuppy]
MSPQDKIDGEQATVRKVSRMVRREYMRAGEALVIVTELQNCAPIAADKQLSARALAAQTHLVKARTLLQEVFEDLDNYARGLTS